MEIRLAMSRDDDFVQHCIQEAYREFPRLSARGGDTLERAASADLERVAAGFAHVANLDGRDVAAAWWAPEANPDDLTVAYFVEPDARNHGVATALLERGLEEARRRGCHGVTIKTHPDNAASVALGRKLGFQPVVTLLRRML